MVAYLSFCLGEVQQAFYLRFRYSVFAVYGHKIGKELQALFTEEELNVVIEYL